jgi:hypothetical protein
VYTNKYFFEITDKTMSKRFIIERQRRLKFAVSFCEQQEIMSRDQQELFVKEVVLSLFIVRSRLSQCFLFLE